MALTAGCSDPGHPADAPGAEDTGVATAWEPLGDDTSDGDTSESGIVDSESDGSDTTAAGESSSTGADEPLDPERDYEVVVTPHVATDPTDFAWQTGWRTRDDNMLQWGNGDHGFGYGGPSVRQLVTSTPAVHYEILCPNETGHPVGNQDNMPYWYMTSENALYIPNFGVYDLDVEPIDDVRCSWTHGNDSGPPLDNGLDWPDGPYWYDLAGPQGAGSAFVPGGAVYKNPFLVWSDELDAGFGIGNGQPAAATKDVRVLYRIDPEPTDGPKWQFKTVRLETWTASGENRNAAALIGTTMYFGGGHENTGDLPSRTNAFWKLDLDAVMATPHGEDVPAAALVEIADLPVGAEVGWGQLNYDEPREVLVYATTRGIWLYYPDQDRWVDRSPAGWAELCGENANFQHGIYSRNRDAHYFRPGHSVHEVVLVDVR